MALFMYRCFHKLSQRLCGVIFGYDQSYIGKIFHETINQLYTSFVPSQISSSCWNRDKINDNTPRYCNDLLNIQQSQVAIVIDGFSISIDKSENIDIQKLTYSLKDHENSINFLGICTLNGR